MNPFFLNQMAMYSAYHRHPRNRATHFIGIPAIVLSVMAALAWVPAGPTNLALVVFAGVALLYLWLDWRIALPTLLAYALLYAVALWIAGLERSLGWTTVGILFVGGWVFQLAGHVFEGRRPALLDNLFQALIAPMFLVAEAAFALGRCKELEAAMEARWPAYRFGPAAGRAASP